MFSPLPRRSRSVRLMLAASLPAAVALSALSARAQPTQPAAPAAPAANAPAANANNGAMMVVVAEVKGTVQVSTDDGKTWAPAKVEMRLGPGAQFRTGFRSSVTCVIPPDQQFTLESLGTVRVAEAAKQGKRVKTDLVMKYGATNYQIEAAGAEHESTIRTPGSTLSVRGTVVRVTDRPGFAPTAESFTGRALYRAGRATSFIGKKGGGYARASAAQPDSAQTALSQSVVDPATSLARTSTDARLIAQQTSLGAVSQFDRRQNITIVTGGSGPVSDAALAATLAGPLEFVLRWTGNANLNFFVDDQPITPADIAKGQKAAAALPASSTAGLSTANLGQIGITNSGFKPQELLYPGFGLNISPTGGTIPFDHRGGPNGGMEIAYWTSNPPQGVFGVGALHVSGAPATYTINAFENGKPLNVFFFGDTGVVKSTAFTGTITGAKTDLPVAGFVYSPSNSLYSNSFPDASAATSGSSDMTGTTASSVTPTASPASSSASGSAQAAAAKPTKPAIKAAQPAARPTPPARTASIPTVPRARGR